MIDLFLTEPFVPFTISLGLLFGLLALEFVFALIGGTILGLGADADLDVDLDMPDVVDFGLDIDGVDMADLEIADFDADVDATAPTTAVTGPLSWLGFGKVPMMIWIAAFLLGFGLSGFVLQQLMNAIFGLALPAAIAIVPAGFAGIAFTSKFSGFFARIIPKTETTAVSNRRLGRRVGTVTQGTARRGKPAEVRVTDRHGNTHYLRGEPLNDDQAITAGTSVLVLRHRGEDGYRLVELGQDA